MSFTWIPLYAEIAHKVLEFQDRQPELLDLLGRLAAEGLKVISLTDEDAEGKKVPLAVIDPFTFFASFNRAGATTGRQTILARIKEFWQLAAPVPDDFTGIPIANAQNSWAFAYLAKRKPTDIPTLWRAAKEGMHSDWRTYDRTLFDKALSVRQMGLARLSMSLFWLNPKGFLSYDKNTRAYFGSRGIVCEDHTALGYFSWLGSVIAIVGSDFPQISHDAYEASEETHQPSTKHDNNSDAQEAIQQYRPLPKEGSRIWLENTKSSHEHGGAGWEFGTCLWSPSKDKGGKDWYKSMRQVQAGDLVINVCDKELRGVSVAKGPYKERSDEPPSPGQWVGMAPFYRVDLEGFTPLEPAPNLDGLLKDRKAEVAHELSQLAEEPGDEEHLRPPFQYFDKDRTRLGLAQTYLTSCSPGLYRIIRDWALKTAADGKPSAKGNEQRQASTTGAEGTGVAHWWLNINPTIWDIRNDPIGFVQTYTSHNENGNKRQKYKHFAAAKPGDLILGYVTKPAKEVLAVCKVTKGLHESSKGEAIEFKITEKFREPVTLADLQSVPSLARCEPLQHNQGSLFALTEDEYDTIREIIDERNPNLPPIKNAPFTKADALKDLFMTEPQFDVILDRLNRKKAIILQGPPGVGKTFIARRLAFARMKERDNRRVTVVQFHPSYSYEDFVQGYRPTQSGLARRDGVFYDFARLARNDPQRDWFFVIDEINRGNLAKIFGELLMLLEADKRGPEHAIPLTYSEKDESFDFPSNLYVIGTMNTADRSLAMVDYALRRRFAFVTLDPAFDAPSFGAWLTERGAPAELLAKIRTRVSAANEVIEKERDLGAGFRIGHSFFCPANGHAIDEAWYREVIESEIQPLLEEYFDSRARVKDLVNDLLA